MKYWEELESVQISIWNRYRYPEIMDSTTSFYGKYGIIIKPSSSYLAEIAVTIPKFFNHTESTTYDFSWSSCKFGIIDAIDLTWLERDLNYIGYFVARMIVTKLLSLQNFPRVDTIYEDVNLFNDLWTRWEDGI